MFQMKDSGAEWIGLIPAEWEMKKAKYVFEQKNEKGNRKSLVLLSPTQNYGVIPQELYERLSGYSAVKLNEKTDLNQLKTVHAGAFVISLRSFQGGFEYSEYEGVVSPAYQVFYPMAPIVDGYFKYLFKSQCFIERMNSYTMSLRDGKNIAFDDFGNTYIPLPPFSVQQRIALFLDDRCAEINALAADIQKQIDILEQYKRSIIIKFVTKGTGENAVMHNSGVKWIGPISDTRKLIKVKYLADILDERRKPVEASKRNQDAEILYPYYGASGEIDTIDGYTIDDHVMLIGEDGANLKLRNLPLMYEVSGKAWINNHAHVLKPKAGVDFYYLFFALESCDINPYITGSAQPKYSRENLERTVVPVPDCKEQAKVSSYLLKQVEAIDEMILLKQKQLTQLGDFTKTLIYEYVTGKKEVPA